MAPPFLQRCQRLFNRQPRANSQQGFTLIELLVTIIIGSLVMTGLLFLVVEMLKMDRDEAALNNTQQTTRRALEYITNDVREAVYVYPSPLTVVDGTDTLIDQLADWPKDTMPVLAFWRVDPLTDAQETTLAGINCATKFPTATDPKRNECETLKVRHHSYTLVVYGQQLNTVGGIWGGESRIIRYALPKYKSSGFADLEIRDGYHDPLNQRDKADDGKDNTTSFNDWKSNGDTTGSAFIATLTDYVDFPNAELPAGDLPECPTGYTRTPSTEVDTAVAKKDFKLEPKSTVGNSFYTCMSFDVAAAGTTDTRGENQDIVMFLRGNAREPGSRQGFGAASRNSQFPTLEAQVLVRSVLDEKR